MLGISPKNPYVILKYLRGLHNHLWKQVMLLKPRTIDEPRLQAEYLENIGNNKGQPIGSKQKDHRDSSKEGKKKRKGNENKINTTAHQ